MDDREWRVKEKIGYRGIVLGLILVAPFWLCIAVIIFKAIR